MAHKIIHKRSSSTGVLPVELELGEIGINTYDGKVFIKKDNGSASVIEVGIKDHTALSNIGSNTHTDIDSHIADNTKHRVIDDESTTTTNLWSASKINDELALKQDELTFDTSPQDLSTNPVESGGVHSALSQKADLVSPNLTGIPTAPTANSNTNTTQLATTQFVQQEIASKISSDMTYKGSYDASTNTPDLDTSPSGVAKGDTYTVTVAGTFFSVALEIGDVIIAEIDNATLESNWTIVNKNLDSSALLDRNNHTGTQTASTISDFDTEVSNNVNVAANTAKLSGIQAGAEVNVQVDWDQTSTGSDDFIKNKPTNVSSFINDSIYLSDTDTIDGGTF